MRIIADTHTHTVASTHAYSTVLEMAQYAEKAGLTALAVTDHTPNSTDGPHVWHFHNLKKALPRELCGVKMIFGAESSIIDYDGTLDFPQEECRALDWIIASVHKNLLPKASVEEIHAKGEKFDLNKHEALMVQASDDVENGYIIEELMKGYMYKDKVLKYSKVIVCKK